MKHLQPNLSSIIAFLAGALIMTVAMVGCGGSDSSSIKTSVDSVSAKGPAPDNNSANNPSSADTNYQKDTGRKITDTPRRP